MDAGDGVDLCSGSFGEGLARQEQTLRIGTGPEAGRSRKGAEAVALASRLIAAYQTGDGPGTAYGGSTDFHTNTRRQTDMLADLVQ